MTGALFSAARLVYVAAGSRWARGELTLRVWARGELALRVWARGELTVRVWALENDEACGTIP